MTFFRWELWDRIRESYSIKRAIYQISKTKDAYVMCRNIHMDSFVVDTFMRLSDVDKGPLPFFYDAQFTFL
ncbi:uncharacterized protein N7483_012115 [Penicillium malachiteum]|uniref:uncharacterized protein n=1 Tax=Penicillium malachiteum TaxID=1324776 RepID=UPI00254928CA|nr:uncharacterized protein N7483_012115 [Penicillium malachiteum]KAJ5714934.1 hypothetical protein N7483_012115 [Penicillium malachiteum]